MKEEQPKVIRKTKGNYCFPNILAEGMKNVSQRTQYEASLLSMIFIMIGLIIVCGYSIFFTSYSLFMKIMIGINTLAGFVFLSSFLITTFQQYTSFLEIMGLLDIQNTIEKEVK